MTIIIIQMIEIIAKSLKYQMTPAIGHYPILKNIEFEEQENYYLAFQLILQGICGIKQRNILIQCSLTWPLAGIAGSAVNVFWLDLRDLQFLLNPFPTVQCSFTVWVKQRQDQEGFFPLLLKRKVRFLYLWKPYFSTNTEKRGRHTVPVQYEARFLHQHHTPLGIRF